MGFERESSKSGAGYVGGFFHLFDWTAKSRKKLFSNKLDLPGTIILHMHFSTFFCFKSVLFSLIFAPSL